MTAADPERRVLVIGGGIGGLATATALRRRGVEVAVAGLVGAVAYNATVSLGVGALVAPLRGVGETRFLLVAAACVVLPLALLVPRHGAVSRWGGWALVVAYLTAVPLLLA